jgi:Ig-like domain from next to BRCA1 gene
MGIHGRRLAVSSMALWALLLVFLSSCGGSKGTGTPTPVVAAVFTSAFNTFVAQRATDAAMATPTTAPSPTLFPTFAPPATLPPISFDTPTALAGGGSDCNKAAFIADVTIPDKTVLNPGQKFTKTWAVQNTGTCPWTTSYTVVHVDGLAMDGEQIYLPLGVPVGQQVQLSINMRAPTSSGQYYGRWRLKTDQGVPFGSILTVVIKVGTLDVTETPEGG